MRTEARAIEFFELVRTRRSIRHFLALPVEARDRRAILEAAARAPSAGNLQAYEIVALEDPARKRAIARAADQSFVAEAGLVLVFCALPPRSAERYGKRGASLYCLQDATLACAYAQLAADALGLGCCWVGAFDPGEVARVVEAPRDALPVAVLAIGHRGESGAVSPRLPLSELVR